MLFRSSIRYNAILFESFKSFLSRLPVNYIPNSAEILSFAVLVLETDWLLARIS